MKQETLIGKNICRITKFLQIFPFVDHT